MSESNRLTCLAFWKKAFDKRLGLSFYRREGAVGNYRNYDTTIYAAAQVKQSDPLSVLLSIMKKNI